MHCAHFNPFAPAPNHRRCIHTTHLSLQPQLPHLFYFHNQRETNYLRYLMLTPDKKRPDHKASADDCTLSQPEYCGIALTERPPRPVVFAPPTTCSIRDGSQVLDLNGDDVFTENRLTPP